MSQVCASVCVFQCWCLCCLHHRSNVCNWQAVGNVLCGFFLFFFAVEGAVRVRSESPSSRPSAIIILERNKFILDGHEILAQRGKTHLSSKVSLTL